MGEYLSCANIFNGTRKRAKVDLIKMIAYGRITNAIKIIQSSIEKDRAKEIFHNLNSNW